MGTPNFFQDVSKTNAIFVGSCYGGGCSHITKNIVVMTTLVDIASLKETLVELENKKEIHIISNYTKLVDERQNKK